MNKICTTIEQSQKLIELGIDVKTADMDYVPCVNDMNEYDYVVNIWNNEHEENWIPCWSLAALLELMPKLYEWENDPEDGGCQPNLCKGWDNNQWHIVYRSSIYITEWYDEPIDAAFEMVCWLKENGKI